MTWTRRLGGVAVGMVAACLSVAQGATPPVAKQAKAPSATQALRAFNQEDYLLAFEAMSSVKNLEQAFQIASEAVKQRPTDMEWRLKLARICDWTERYAEAAGHWKVLFQSGNHSAETLQAMLRLLPQLGEPETALQVWAVLARKRPLTEKEWRDVYELYESAAQPREGSGFFETQYRRLQHPYLLELAAVLAEHAENMPRAASLYIERSALQPFSMDMVLRAVVSLIRLDRLPDALTLMQRHEPQIDAGDFAFWQILGQIAWEQHAYDTAQVGYERLTKLPQATAGDWSRLIYLVRQKHPEQAASLSMEAYRRFGTPDLLMQALGIYGETSNVAAQARVLQTLSATELAQAEQITQFLLIRAQIQRNNKQPDLAWQDLRQAMLQAPDSDEVGVTALWFLIDHKRVTDLAALLRQLSQRATDTALYWLPFAVASQVLDRHADAVRWYAKEVKRSPDDPLLLLNYADAMERTRQAGMAARLRRHAWLLLKQKYPQPENFSQLSSQPEMLALARLTMLDSPGDTGLRLVRKLVNQARLTPSERTDEQTLALVLGWAILKDQPANARAWMWRRYANQANQLEAPLWGQAQVALQLQDTAAMASLLERNSAGLPIYNRYDMAQELGHVEQAQDIAFKGMSEQAGDEPLYDRYRVHVPLQANYLQTKVTSERQGSLDTLGMHFETRLALSPKLHLILNAAQVRPVTTDPTLSLLAPGQDRLQSLELRWQGAAGQTSVTVSRADKVDATTGLRISQTLQWGGRASLEARLDHRVESTLSAPLRLVGLENALGFSLNYTLGKREYFRFSPRVSNYVTQQGDYLGRGRSLDFEMGYRIRTDYPDWRVRAFVTHQKYSRNQNLSAATLRLPPSLQTALAASGLSVSDYFLPQGSTTLGACVSMGENVGGQSLQTVYSRAWRPYLDVCLTRNRLNGLSYNGLLGLAGSVTGEDHLSVQLQNSNSTQTQSAATQSLAIRYRHYY